METNNIKLLDVVALIVDLTEYNIVQGQVGTVVDILADGKALKLSLAIAKDALTNQ